MNLKYFMFLFLLGNGFNLLSSVPIFSAEKTDIEKGEYIFKATGGCGCHTDYEKEGAFLAGGRPIETPFGTFFSTNITPDSETGIGQWSNEDFIKAMTEGVGPEGTHYAPAFPYTSFTQMTEGDLLHLKAYLASVPAVRQENKPHDLFIPFGERIGFFLWKKMFFKPSAFQKDPQKSDQWNRGAYLSDVLAHCGECHTPRTVYGVLKKDMHYAGSKEGPEGEEAPNITPDEETGIGDWAVVDIVDFLKSGLEPDGDDVQGLMALVIEHGFAELTPEDLEAIAVYLKSLPPIHNQLRDEEEDEDEKEE